MGGLNTLKIGLKLTINFACREIKDAETGVSKRSCLWQFSLFILLLISDLFLINFIFIFIFIYPCIPISHIILHYIFKYLLFICIYCLFVFIIVTHLCLSFTLLHFIHVVLFKNMPVVFTCSYMLYILLYILVLVFCQISDAITAWAIMFLRINNSRY